MDGLIILSLLQKLLSATFAVFFIWVVFSALREWYYYLRYKFKK
nr:MAG TPA: hypothetical protein [Caudoviricetes sp.]